MRVALYARVSTERQEKEKTIGSQLDALQARAATETWAVEMTCADEGYSGRGSTGPGWTAFATRPQRGSSTPSWPSARTAWPGTTCTR